MKKQCLPVVRIPHLPVDISLQLLLSSVLQRLQHFFVRNLQYPLGVWLANLTFVTDTTAGCGLYRCIDRNMDFTFWTPLTSLAACDKYAEQLKSFTNINSLNVKISPRALPPLPAWKPWPLGGKRSPYGDFYLSSDYLNPTWCLPSLGMWPDGPGHLDQLARQEPERNGLDGCTPPWCCFTSPQLLCWSWHL